MTDRELIRQALDAFVRAVHAMDSEQEPETYREGILVGPCFCRKWPGGVPPIRHWVGLTDDDEIPWDGVDAKSFARAIEAKLRSKNT